MSEIGKKFRFKITVIGDGMVGKTSLIKKFTKGSFVQDYVKTIGAQFSVFDKQIDEDKIRLLFWDIAGQESFSQLRKGFYTGSRACIIVFSHEENEHGEDSFKNISKWLNDIKKNCGHLPIILFGNKTDLVRLSKEINDEQLGNLKEELSSFYNFNKIKSRKWNFLFTSVKTNFNIDNVIPAIFSLLSS